MKCVFIGGSNHGLELDVVVGLLYVRLPVRTAVKRLWPGAPDIVEGYREIFIGTQRLFCIDSMPYAAAFGEFFRLKVGVALNPYDVVRLAEKPEPSELMLDTSSLTAPPMHEQRAAVFRSAGFALEKFQRAALEALLKSASLDLSAGMTLTEALSPPVRESVVLHYSTPK